MKIIRLFRSDLLHISGVGHSSPLGIGFQQGQEEAKKPSPATSGAGSDILDSNSHDLRLEKSNILLLGPTGSGKNITKLPPKSVA